MTTYRDAEEALEAGVDVTGEREERRLVALDLIEALEKHKFYADDLEPISDAISEFLSNDRWNAETYHGDDMADYEEIDGRLKKLFGSETK